MTPDSEAEVLETRDVIHMVWDSAKEGLRPHKHVSVRQNNIREEHEVTIEKRRSTVIMSPKLDAVHTNGQRDPYDASFDDRFVLLNVLEGPPIRPMLELLVAMSGALSKENYVELGPGLWGRLFGVVRLQDCDIRKACTTSTLQPF